MFWKIFMKNWKMKSNFDSTPPSGKPDTSPQSREGLRKVCVALLQSREGLKFLPSLRGDVNEVDRGELLTSEIKNLRLKIKSTPSSAKADTSPQSREGLRKVCVALPQSWEGLRKVCVVLPQSREGLRKSLKN